MGPPGPGADGALPNHTLVTNYYGRCVPPNCERCGISCIRLHSAGPWPAQRRGYRYVPWWYPPAAVHTPHGVPSGPLAIVAQYMLRPPTPKMPTPSQPSSALSVCVCH